MSNLDKRFSFSYIVRHYNICYNVIRSLLFYPSTKTKTPRTVIPRVFYSVFLWWLIPQAGHRLFITIQPFVDAMTRYTSHDSEYKADYSIHILTSFPYRWEAVTVLPQHIMYCNYVEACQLRNLFTFCTTLQKITATVVLTAVARIAGPTIAVGSALPYFAR